MAVSQILAGIGPFTGLDLKTPPRQLPPGKSVAESGLESYVTNGAFVPVIGRTLLVNNSSIGASTFVSPIVVIGRFPTPVQFNNYIVATGPATTTSNGATLAALDGNVMAALSFPAGINSPISLSVNSRAVQYQNFLFLSGLQTGLSGTPVPLVKLDSTNTITEWQMPAPIFFATVGVSCTFTVSGAITNGNVLTPVLVYMTPTGSLSTSNTYSGASYTIQPGDTATTVATNWAAAINTFFQGLFSGNTGAFASSSGTSLTINLPGLGSGSVVGTPYYIAVGITQTAAVTTFTPSTVPAAESGAYIYTTTYSNATQESSPGPLGISSAGALGASGPFFFGSGVPIPPSPFNAGIPTTQTTEPFVSGTGTTDAYVTTLNYYRLGGSVGQWTFVGSFSNPGNHAKFFLDPAADAALTGQNLVNHRDPPVPFNDIFLHKDRIFGFGENFLPNGQGNLWYSNYKEPWSFDNVNQILPVGQVTAGDVAVAGVSIGSIAILLKAETGYILYGDSQVDFLVRPAFNIGCGAQFSLCQGEGIGYWISQDRRVYSFDGNSLQYLSKDIQPTLSSLTKSQTQAIVGWYYEQKYYLSIPALQKTFYYDTLHQEWHRLPFYTTCAEANAAMPEVLASNPSAWEIDTWFTGVTDNVAGGGFSPTYTSAIFTQPDDSIKRYRWLQIEAPASAASYPMTVVITVNPQSPLPYQRSYTQAFDLINGSQVFGLPNLLLGSEVQITVTGAPSTNGQTPILEKVLLRGSVRHAIRTLDIGPSQP